MLNKFAIFSMLSGIAVLVMTVAFGFPGMPLWQAILSFLLSLVVAFFASIGIILILVGAFLLFLFK